MILIVEANGSSRCRFITGRSITVPRGLLERAKEDARPYPAGPEASRHTIFKENDIELLSTVISRLKLVHLVDVGSRLSSKCQK